MSDIQDEIKRDSSVNEQVFELLKELKADRPSVFIFRMNSNSLESEGIYPADLLVVDRNISVTDASFVLTESNGKLTVRSIFDCRFKQVVGPGAVEIDGASPKIWGVVTFVIHSLFSHRVAKKRVTFR